MLASGARSWIVYYRLGKAQRKVSLGDVALLTPTKAREKAKEILAKAKLGQELEGEYPEPFVQRYPDLKGLVKILPTPASRKLV